MFVAFIVVVLTLLCSQAKERQWLCAWTENGNRVCTNGGRKMLGGRRACWLDNKGQMKCDPEPKKKSGN
ncbi:unnamed protein product [Nippostrongylus brasiliensis]|uniref:DUF3012 domain-containing protein n=1 Tax=Nippostrongylus brasiliensis TaxID=27835 RepID=A0A0N4XXA9_NIPBR|nr:unnamed protein product [Nippostrongylus brasiliensis]